jgi:RecA-family ATPase
MPLEQQIQFWAGAPVPVVALIDSGGKSIHGWVRIDAANADEWVRRVENRLFALLTAVGADGACKNEARLSRMPGGIRAETGRCQHLLYLSPAGGPVLP